MVKMNVLMSLFDCDLMLNFLLPKLKMSVGLFKCHSTFFSDSLHLGSANKNKNETRGST